MTDYILSNATTKGLHPLSSTEKLLELTVVQTTKQHEQRTRLGEARDAYPNAIQSTAEIDLLRLPNDSPLAVQWCGENTMSMG